jgi:hypothetical protein
MTPAAHQGELGEPDSGADVGEVDTQSLNIAQIARRRARRAGHQHQLRHRDDPGDAARSATRLALLASNAVVFVATLLVGELMSVSNMAPATDRDQDWPRHPTEVIAI